MDRESGHSRGRPLRSAKSCGSRKFKTASRIGALALNHSECSGPNLLVHPLDCLSTMLHCRAVQGESVPQAWASLRADPTLKHKPQGVPLNVYLGEREVQLSRARPLGPVVVVASVSTWGWHSRSKFRCGFDGGGAVHPSTSEVPRFRICVKS